MPFDPQLDYGVVVEDLSSGARTSINEQRVFPSASVYKLALACQVLSQAEHGRVHLDAPLEILDEDADEAEPEGGVGPGDRPTMREALNAMFSVSSNAAAHALLRTLGRHEFNTAMNALGLPQTRVPEASDPESDNGVESMTTADDMARLLRLIGERQGLGAATQADLRDLLAQSSSPDPLRETLPDDVTILDKTGNLVDASNVSALLSTDRGTVILIVLDEQVNPGNARALIAQLGRAAYEGYLQ